LPLASTSSVIDILRRWLYLALYRQMVKRLVNNELKGIWQEAVLA
jgi:hypothetical protein